MRGVALLAGWTTVDRFFGGEVRPAIATRKFNLPNQRGGTMKVLTVILAVFTMATAARAEDLSWADLARRPELWPAQCAIKEAIQFQGGMSVKAGQTLNVLEIKANDADVQTTDGRLHFAAEPDQTDILNLARDAYAKLTPKQQALTYASLIQRKELWPDHVTINRTIYLAANGPVVRAGDQVTLKDVEPGKLVVVDEKLHAKFPVGPNATDLMAQARDFAESKEGVSPRYLAEKAMQEKTQREGPVVMQLEGKLINSLTGQPEPLDTNSLPRYIVFLRGQSTCPITRRFAPTVIKYCEQMKPKHPEFEVVYLTIEDLPETEKFAKELGFNWRTVTYENATMPCVNPYIDGKIPQFIVMDRSGKVLANGIQGTAPAALQQLDALLKQPVN